MKRLLIFLCLISLLTGCNSSNNATQKENTDSTENTKIEVPIDLVEYLSVDDENVKQIKIDDNMKKYFFEYHDDNDIYEYVRIMEGKGYVITNLDGNVSSTFYLENPRFKIEITLISDFNEWKIINNDKYDLSDITSENILYIVEEVEE